MCKVLFVFLVCCFATSLVRAQNNDKGGKTTVEYKTTLAYETTLENKITLGNRESLESSTVIAEKNSSEQTKQSFENGTELENRKMLENITLKKNSSLDGRIVNGTEAYLGQFPSQVSLRRTGTERHFCGGSIIHVQWVLTAAHCMYIMQTIEIKPSSITVVAGDILLEGTSRTQQKRVVSKIIRHENFKMDTLENDITLLQLKEPFVPNEALQVARMPTGQTKPGTPCDISGWGYPNEDEQYVSNIQMFVTLPLLPQKICRILLNSVSDVPDGMLCAGYIKGGKDACQGDSGGGMLCKNNLTGVVSGGKGCAKPRLPGLYTDVYLYRDWIKYSMLNRNVSTILLMKKNSGQTTLVNMFWLVSSLFSAFLLSMYC